MLLRCRIDENDPILRGGRHAPEPRPTPGEMIGTLGRALANTLFVALVSVSLASVLVR
jgi:hypothetical protein